MKCKTPPGFYVVLALALIGFIYGTGITRIPPSPLPLGDCHVPEAGGRIGIYLTSHALGQPGIMDAILAAGDAGQINTLVINAKNMHGEVTYDSLVPLASDIGASTGRVDFASVLAQLRARGFYLIARQVLFFDPLLADHLGLSESWVPADHPVARQYNLDLALEISDLGFDELQFDYVRFEDGGALEDVYQDRFAAVASFLEKAEAVLGNTITLSADIFGRVMWPWNMRRVDPIGQSLEDMAPYLDAISPMVYPSHYYEQSYRDDPYLTVKDALNAGASRVNARIRPFLQAFDRHLPAGMSLESYIAEQIRAAEEHGADGYLFWHPACRYESLFNVL